jgi:hypothetical protein
MNTRSTIAIAEAAGFIGGFASRYIEPAPVLAQAEVAQQVIRAQKYMLVDGTSAAREAFGIEENGAPQIRVIGYNGHGGSNGQVYANLFRPWSMVHGLMAESRSNGPREPTLLPVNP